MEMWFSNLPCIFYAFDHMLRSCVVGGMIASLRQIEYL